MNKILGAALVWFFIIASVLYVGSCTLKSVRGATESAVTK